MIAAGYQHFGKLGVQGEFRHYGPQIGEIAVVVKGGQVIQKLQGSHQGFGRWRVHKIEMHQIVNTQFFELENHRTQIWPKDKHSWFLFIVTTVSPTLKFQDKCYPASHFWTLSPYKVWNICRVSFGRHVRPSVAQTLY